MKNTFGSALTLTLFGESHGSMIGVVLDRPAAGVSALCLKRRLVTLTAGENVLRLLPPLIISRAEADLALERIAGALEEFNETEVKK